jgi:transcriptional regulator
VVPTWNYAVVHAYGKLQIVDDAAWLRDQLEALTNQNEAAFAQPWRLGDAPPAYIAKLTEAIVGLEITITRLVGKWKVGQNQSVGDRAGVVQGLRSSEGMADSLAMATLMEEGGMGPR